jgi:hypothetical protein
MICPNTDERTSLCPCGACRSKRLQGLRRSKYAEPLLRRARLQAAHAAECRPVPVHRAAERLAREIESYLSSYVEFWAIAREGA